MGGKTVCNTSSHLMTPGRQATSYAPSSHSEHVRVSERAYKSVWPRNRLWQLKQSSWCTSNPRSSLHARTSLLMEACDTAHTGLYWLTKNLRSGWWTYGYGGSSVVSVSDNDDISSISSVNRFGAPAVDLARLFFKCLKSRTSAQNKNQ
jgi:hypothetical protein